MPDLNDLFRSSIELEGEAVAGDPAVERQAAPTSGSSGPAADPPGGGAPEDAQPDDDVLVDLRALVAEWNAEHERTGPAPLVGEDDPVVDEAVVIRADADLVGVGAVESPRAITRETPLPDVRGLDGAPADAAEPSPGTSVPVDGSPARRSRLASAASIIAEHIGNYPESRAEPPVPEGTEPPASDGGPGDGPAAPPLPVGDAAGPGQGLVAPGSLDDQLVTVNRRERRRARREIDRLQRDCARRPMEFDAEKPDVVLLGAVPTSPASLVPPVRVPDAVPALAPGGEPPRRREVAPAAPAADTEPVSGSRRERRRAWKAAEKSRRVDARRSVRFPIFTRSVLVWLFVFAVAGLAFGASSAFWWSQYNGEVDEIRMETNAFTDQVQGAAAAVEAQRQAALAEIDDNLAVFDRLSQPGQAPAVAAAAAPSVFLIETRDEAGAAVVGTAFVVANTEEQSLLLTSLDVVATSTTVPGPEIHLRQGDRDLVADLWSWDVDTDLALLVVDDPALPPLAWAGDDVASQALSSGIFAVGGLGGQGATAIPGLVVDQSAQGFQHTAVVGAAYRGGPLLTNDGLVLGVASLAYQPLGFDPGDVHFSVPVRSACGTVLSCPGGVLSGPGAEGGAALPSDEAEAAPAEAPQG